MDGRLNRRLNRRRHARHDCGLRARLRTGRGLERSFILRDVSASGLNLHFENDEFLLFSECPTVPFEERVLVTIELPAGQGSCQVVARTRWRSIGVFGDDVGCSLERADGRFGALLECLAARDRERAGVAAARARPGPGQHPAGRCEVERSAA